MSDRIHKSCLCWIIIHRSSTWPRKLCPATVAVPGTILVTLSPYGLCRHWELHYLWFLLICMRRRGGPSRGRERYIPISILAIVARFNITNGRVLDAIARAWANAIRGRLLASKYYTKITPEGMRLRLRPMCWFSHWIDNSVSSSNIIDGGSQFIGKQWEHHIKTNGSKISKPMGARPWLLEYRAMCLYVILISDFPFTIIATMCVGIADTNALVLRQWMGELFYENMGNHPNILQFTVLKMLVWMGPK